MMKCELCRDNILHEGKLSLELYDKKINSSLLRYKDMTICQSCFWGMLGFAKQIMERSME